MQDNRSFAIHVMMPGSKVNGGVENAVVDGKNEVENAVLYAGQVRAGQAIKRWKRQWAERKTHRFFRCKCGAVIRVPKGRGKIEITCPKCKEHMIKCT